MTLILNLSRSPNEGISGDDSNLIDFGVDKEVVRAGKGNRGALQCDELGEANSEKSKVKFFPYKKLS